MPTFQLVAHSVNMFMVLAGRDVMMGAPTNGILYFQVVGVTAMIINNVLFVATQLMSYHRTFVLTIAPNPIYTLLFIDLC